MNCLKRRLCGFLSGFSIIALFLWNTESFYILLSGFSIIAFFLWNTEYFYILKPVKSFESNCIKSKT